LRPAQAQPRAICIDIVIDWLKLKLTRVFCMCLLIGDGLCLFASVPSIFRWLETQVVFYAGFCGMTMPLSRIWCRDLFYTQGHRNINKKHWQLTSCQINKQQTAFASLVCYIIHWPGASGLFWRQTPDSVTVHDNATKQDPLSDLFYISGPDPGHWNSGQYDRKAAAAAAGRAFSNQQTTLAILISGRTRSWRCKPQTRRMYFGFISGGGGGGSGGGGPLGGEPVARDGEGSRGRRAKRETPEGTKDRTNKGEQSDKGHTMRHTHKCTSLTFT
jgi:hypothetical protein